MIKIRIRGVGFGGIPEDGYYPAAYSVKYDPVRREYTIALDAITRR